jgi:hypothetical protein
LADVGAAYRWAVGALIQTIAEGQEALRAEVEAKARRYGLRFDVQAPFESCSMSSPSPQTP